MSESYSLLTVSVFCSSDKLIILLIKLLNPFTPENPIWTLQSLNLDTSIVANRDFVKLNIKMEKKCVDPNKTAPYGPPHLDLQFAKVSVLIFRDGRNGFSIICLYIDTSLKLKWSGDKVFKSCKSALTRTTPHPHPVVYSTDPFQAVIRC